MEVLLKADENSLLAFFFIFWHPRCAMLHKYFFTQRRLEFFNGQIGELKKTDACRRGFSQPSVFIWFHFPCCLWFVCILCQGLYAMEWWVRALRICLAFCYFSSVSPPSFSIFKGKRDQSSLFLFFSGHSMFVMLPIHVKLWCTVHTCLGSEKFLFSVKYVTGNTVVFFINKDPFLDETWPWVMNVSVVRRWRTDRSMYVNMSN